MATSPLEQFLIKPLIPIRFGDCKALDPANPAASPGPGCLDFSFTNSALFMVIAVVLIGALMTLGVRGRGIVPGRVQSIAEMSYELVAGLIRETVGSEGRRYFPLIFTLFMFVLFGNTLGMIPYTFTFTSHIIVTFAMAIVVFVAVTILGFMRHGTHFFTFFVPPGVPIAIWPLLIPIEIISYLSRPVALAVRLFANMLAGHTLLKVIAGFVPALGIAGIVPLAFVTVLTGLEFLIAFLQAYVFTILTCLYINDALHLH